MTIVNIIGTALMVLVGLLAVWAFINIFKFFLMFHVRHCKQCGHVMKFKDCQEDLDGVYYRFHCEKCGTWEKVSRKEMLNEEESHVVS